MNLTRRTSSEGNTMRWLVMACLAGMIVLLPEQFIELPLNLASVDILIGLSIPLLWLYLISRSHPVRLPYAGAMWLILLASFLSTFESPEPIDSLVVIMKEVYLYVWFVTMVAVLSCLGDKARHQLMAIWAAVALLHGLLLVLQFISPEIFQRTQAFLNSLGPIDQWRPSGTFENANASAFFQVMSFVPLVLIVTSRKLAVVLSLFLALSVVATGSMGATAAMLGGLTIAVLAYAIANRRLAALLKYVAVAGVIILVLGGATFAVISQNAEYSQRLEYLFYGRAERSADGRFALWQRGLATFSSRVPVWGIGPESFKYVDIRGTQLHNDFIAFTVERGLIGVGGLSLFVLVATRSALLLLQAHQTHPDRYRATTAVFLAAVVAVVLESLTHQIFHARPAWLVLAFQEALLLTKPATDTENDVPTNLFGVGQKLSMDAKHIHGN